MKNLSNEYQNKRILIVGSNGYIASNLISVLINYKCTVPYGIIHSGFSLEF